MDWATVKTQGSQIKTAIDNVVDGLREVADELTLSDFALIIRWCENVISQVAWIRDKAMEKKAKTQAELDQDVFEAVRAAGDCIELKSVDADGRPLTFTYTSESVGKVATVTRRWLPHPQGKRVVGVDLEIADL